MANLTGRTQFERLQEMNRMGRQKDDPDMANQAQEILTLIDEGKL